MSETLTSGSQPYSADSPHPIDQAWSPLPSTSKRIEAGKELRQRYPRNELGRISQHDRDPLGILEKQNSGRLQDLVPLRAERMSQSAFAFYRGSAAIMAHDLAADAHTDIVVASCGDAHLANFGFYASPQRTLVFDLNDFDEAAWAPWEWDLKRLLTSIVLAGRATSRDDAQIRVAVLRATRAYAQSIRTSSRLTPVERYYTHFDTEAGVDALPERTQKVLAKAITQARKRTGERAVRKLATADAEGRLRFEHDLPTMGPLTPEREHQVHHLLRRYLSTANADIRQLLRNYVVADAARRVVGVGSVGTRCALTLLQDGDGGALILQSKEAGRSVLEEYGGISQPRAISEHVAANGEGGRVVALQRVLQAVSDPFLGYLRTDGIDMYVRQFHDMKGGIEAETLDDQSFSVYAQACAITLARAHSQSPLSATISGYIGGGGTLGPILLEWAYGYADVAEADFHAFVAAQGDSAGR